MPLTAVQNHQLFIGGEWQGAFDDRTFEKTNPFTGEIISRFSSAGRKGVCADLRLALSQGRYQVVQGAELQPIGEPERESLPSHPILIGEQGHPVLR